ncbi:MAG: hypothetical protein K2X81_16535 [Candidatus Obscuribacterales bacterium]|nr:hypothetical protein [Candidatus Obscuribacterales bacterium]
MTRKVPSFDKILKSYSKCLTYQDVGTWTDANGSSSNFSTIFIRPDKFYFQLKSGKWTSILWNSGAQIFTYSESPGSTRLTPFGSLADAMRKELQKPVGFSLLPTLLSPALFEVSQGFFEHTFEGHDLDENTYLYSSAWKPLLNVEIRVNKITRVISKISYERDRWRNDLEQASYQGQSTHWEYTKACFNDDVVTKIFDYKPSKTSST